MIYTEIQGSRLSLVPFIKTRIYHKTPNKNCKNIFNQKELKVQNPSFSLANRFQSRYKTHPLIRQIIPEKKINILSSKSQIKKKKLSFNFATTIRQNLFDFLFLYLPVFQLQLL